MKTKKKTPKLPFIGYMAVWPDNRIVKVKVERQEKDGFPFKVSAVEPGEKITPDWDFVSIADLSVITVHPTRKKAYHTELEKLHGDYRNAKRTLRSAEKNVKFANRRIFEYKNFERLYSIVNPAQSNVVA